MLGVTFVVADLIKGAGMLSEPLKARKALNLLSSLLKRAPGNAGALLEKMLVRSSALYGSVALEHNPKAETLQNEAVSKIIGAHRNDRTTRKNLALGMSSLAGFVAGNRINAAMSACVCAYPELRELIVAARAEGWAFGKLLDANLQEYGLEELFDETLAALTAHYTPSALHSFKRKVAEAIKSSERTTQITDCFSPADRGELQPLSGAHPVVCDPASGKRFGYMFLRDEFEPPPCAPPAWLRARPLSLLQCGGGRSPLPPPCVPPLRRACPRGAPAHRS